MQDPDPDLRAGSGFLCRIRIRIFLQDPDPDSKFDKSDPDPKQIFFGPQHCLERRKFVFKFMKIVGTLFKLDNCRKP